jgi:hypothetical protein
MEMFDYPRLALGPLGSRLKLSCLKARWAENTGGITFYPLKALSSYPLKALSSD